MIEDRGMLPYFSPRPNEAAKMQKLANEVDVEAISQVRKLASFGV